MSACGWPEPSTGMRFPRGQCGHACSSRVNEFSYTPIDIPSLEKEATGGFEPPIAVLQTTALPLGYVAGGTLDAELYMWIGVARERRMCHSSHPCLIALLAMA